MKLSFFLRPLMFWLLVFEVIAQNRRWRGLSWLPWSLDLRLLGVLPVLVFAGLRGSWWVRAAGLVASAPVALLAQIGASSVRNRALTPLTRLVPGEYERVRVERHDIPMAEAFLPALHIVPLGGAQKAVCVLHGSGCNKVYYAWRLVDTLLNAGCAVLLIDLDGHGENPRPQRFPQILENPQVAVAWLRERYAQVGLLGISLGGCIAARAVADGLIVDSMAVLESPPKLYFTRADVWREGAALPRFELLGLFEEISAQNVVRAWASPPIRAQISTWDLIEQLDLLGSLQRIHTPLLLLYGAHDSIVKPKQAREVAAAKPAHAEFRFIRRASHLTLQLMPAALQALGDWFRTM